MPCKAIVEFLMPLAIPNLSKTVFSLQMFSKNKSEAGDFFSSKCFHFRQNKDLTGKFEWFGSTTCNQILTCGVHFDAQLHKQFWADINNINSHDLY